MVGYTYSDRSTGEEGLAPYHLFSVGGVWKMVYEIYKMVGKDGEVDKDGTQVFIDKYNPKKSMSMG